MTLQQSTPVALAADAQVVMGPWAWPDDEPGVRASLARPWDPKVTATVTIEVSFDGVTWQPLCRTAGHGGGDEVLIVGVDVAPQQCAVCGQPYAIGAEDAPQLSHAAVALRASKTVADLQAATRETTITAADFARKVLPSAGGVDRDAEYFVRTFHRPMPAVVARQVRVRLTAAAGIVRSAVTVETGAWAPSDKEPR